jgi:hypothetical protein
VVVMQRWLTLDRTGNGTSANPYRPDFKGVANVRGFVVAAYAGTSVLVKVTRDQGPLDQLKNLAGARHHGDETAGNHASVKSALHAECDRLGVARIDPSGYDVAE